MQRGFTPPFVDDGLIEVVGFRDAWHGLVLLAPNGHGTRLAQVMWIQRNIVHIFVSFLLKVLRPQRSYLNHIFLLELLSNILLSICTNYYFIDLKV
jgi:hypothetical protein